MTWTKTDFDRIKKRELEIAEKIEKLGKKYKLPGIFSKNFMLKNDNNEKLMCDTFSGEWGKDCFCYSYHMEKQNMFLSCYHKHDLIVVVEMITGYDKNEIKTKMTTTLELGFPIFKPVLLIQYYIMSEIYNSYSEDSNININPMPIVWKKLGLTKEERRNLEYNACKKLGIL